MALKSNLVASRYAAVLLDMAAEAKSVEKVEKDMGELANMIAGSADLQNLIRNPLTGCEKQKRVIRALAENAEFQILTANFLGILAQNRRLPAIQAVITAFKVELTRRRGEVAVEVQSACALSEAQTKALQEQLGKAVGSHVTLNVDVNKDLLGGMIVTVGSLMIDDSVRSKLERLQRAMKSGSNENQQLKEVG